MSSQNLGQEEAGKDPADDVMDEEQQKKEEKTAEQPANDNPDEMTLEDLIKGEKKSLRDRIIKQKQKVKVTEGKNFNERQNINFEEENLEIRSDVLHVYGVDFLSTEDIMNYFSRFQPKNIEWLNDSSCNVVFPSEELADQAEKSLSLTLQNDPNLSEEWKKGLPYKERNIEFSLYFRIATTKVIYSPIKQNKYTFLYLSFFNQLIQILQLNNNILISFNSFEIQYFQKILQWFQHWK